MSNVPMRVSLLTSVDDIRQTMASHCSRLALSAGNTGKKWSSMKSMEAITMSPCAMSALQRARAAASSSHSAAACTLKTRPGMLRTSRCWARSAALARWLSIVTNTTRMATAGAARRPSAAEMSFCIVQGVHGNERNAAFAGVGFGVPAGFATHEERDFFELALGLWTPGEQVAGHGTGRA